MGETDIYSDFYDDFSFFDQQSPQCRIEIVCQDEGAKQTCNELAKKWKVRYNRKGNNKYGCKYIFSIIWSLWLACDN